jgi:2'-5' RNA ligase
MRLFYAVKFNDNIKTALTENLGEIKKHTIKGSFTEKDNFHITLVFVGECEPDMLEDLKKVVDNTAANFNGLTAKATPVKAYMSGLGTFARPGDELLWVGVKTEPENILEKLNKTILEELNKCGIKIKDDKKFSPHVTLARRVVFKDITSKDLHRIKFEPINFAVKSVTLMESVQEITTVQRDDGERQYTRIIYNPVYEVKF